MPKFTIEATFDVPHYRHVVYEAATVAEAIKMALADDDWDHQEKDYDSSSDVRITGAWAGEKAYDGKDLPIGTEPVSAPDGEELAHANLIAAAPEMLAALKSVAQCLRDGAPVRCGAQVNAAITKAESTQ